MDTDYNTLLRLFCQLVDSQTGKKPGPGQTWLKDAEVLAVKLYHHLVSMRTLAAGEITGDPITSRIRFIDHASVKVVTRAAFETYLVFFYIYGNSDPKLSEFRHKTWSLGGLIDRQNIHTCTEEGREFLAREAKIIEKLKTDIIVSFEFQNFTPKQRKELLKGNWRVDRGWTNLGINAGFNKKYFENTYRYLCGYSHSSHLSILQVDQALTIDEQWILTYPFLEVGLVLMAHFAFSYSNLFGDAKKVLLTNPAALNIAKKWQFGSEDMATLYGGQ